MAVGRVAIAMKPLAINQDLRALLPNNKVDSRYLFHVLRSKERQIASSGRGATVKGIRIDQVRAIDVPLPRMNEQKRIAAILDEAEALVENRRRSIDFTEALVQSTFLDLFGDPVLNRRRWPVRKLAGIGTLERGVSKHRPRNAPELLGGPHPFVQTGDVANCNGYVRTHSSTYSDVGLLQSKLWPAGTLCITIAANIGKVAILTFDACFPDSVVGFRAEDPATNEYVRVWFSFLQRSLEEAAPESAQKNINLAILRNLDIAIPPRNLREEFRRRVAAIERTKAVQRTSEAKLGALFASLQHRAFRGEL
jgi:type I restriction enzyme S subunit